MLADLGVIDRLEAFCILNHGLGLHLLHVLRHHAALLGAALSLVTFVAELVDRNAVRRLADLLGVLLQPAIGEEGGRRAET